MFYVLCVALCLAVLFLVLSAAIAVSLPLSNVVQRFALKATSGNAADVILGVRIAPFVLAAMAGIGLVVPAFLEFEPRSTREMLDWPLLALALCGAAVLLLIVGRMTAMLRATWKLERHWLADSVQLDLAGVACPVYCVPSATSLLAVTGTFRPRIFISAEIGQALNAQELSAALAHEMAHLDSLDNLKQLLLRSLALPFTAFRALDRAWASASEIAADEDAVRSGASALELSSALVKVGRLSSRRNPTPRLAASHLVPEGCGTSTSSRAAHLSALLSRDAMPDGRPSRLTLLTMVLVLVATYCVCLSALLPAVHEALEWMVR
ncbi:MAG TPA: M56 family metallopeptidase [Terriglobales bacterium]|nr:M56 family metallopeptidase [Terriglobales bacterium]